MADRISIFYGGTILETLKVEDFLKGDDSIKHPYTRALWAALPQNKFEAIDMKKLALECEECGLPLPASN